LSRRYQDYQKSSGNQNTIFVTCFKKLDQFTYEPLKVKVLAVKEDVEEGGGADNHYVEVATPQGLI
jgi:hypothetical protein